MCPPTACESAFVTVIKHRGNQLDREGMCSDLWSQKFQSVVSGCHCVGFELRWDILVAGLYGRQGCLPHGTGWQQEKRVGAVPHGKPQGHILFC